MKEKLHKPRNWSIVQLIKKHNSGVHETRKSRSGEKNKLMNKIKTGKVEEI